MTTPTPSSGRCSHAPDIDNAQRDATTQDKGIRWGSAVIDLYTDGRNIGDISDELQIPAIAVYRYLERRRVLRQVYPFVMPVHASMDTFHIDSE